MTPILRELEMEKKCPREERGDDSVLRKKKILRSNPKRVAGYAYDKGGLYVTEATNSWVV